MKHVLTSIAAGAIVVGMMIAGCAPAAPAAAPAKAPAAQPTAVPAAKATWPEKGKTITFISPWEAGGTTDLQARIMAPLLEKELGVPVQVVNRPGASSQIGLTELAKAKPDGYTIAIINTPAGAVAYLDKERNPAFGRKDLLLVANQVWDPVTVAVTAQSPYKSLKDLLDAAKANPNTIKTGTTGISGDASFGARILQDAADIDLRITHFDGGGPLRTAFQGGHIELAVMSVGGTTPLLKNGVARVFAVLDKERSKFLPEVPTMDEVGFKGKNAYMGSTRGVAVPAGTPKAAVDVLSVTLKKMMDNPELTDKLNESFLGQRFMGPEEFGAFWDDYEKSAARILELVSKGD